ncbi:PREDICTED: uncharacterized protein LOC101810217, partial [Ficedula albicollis]|uniref:uncharacterized protein LOC101810217 n=1 Tax=Ficedula albicollis TaxID=59894 RepID=UPI00035932B7
WLTPVEVASDGRLRQDVLPLLQTTHNQQPFCLSEILSTGVCASRVRLDINTTPQLLPRAPTPSKRSIWNCSCSPSTCTAAIAHGQKVPLPRWAAAGGAARPHPRSAGHCGSGQCPGAVPGTDARTALSAERLSWGHPDGSGLGAWVAAAPAPGDRSSPSAAIPRGALARLPASWPALLIALRYRRLSSPCCCSHGLSHCSALASCSSSPSRGQSPPGPFPSVPQAGQLPAVGRLLLQGPRLSCPHLSDNELGAHGVLQRCRQLRHPACPLRSLGLSTDAFSQALRQQLDAVRALQPALKIGNLLEHDVPQAGAMARLPCQRGLLPGAGRRCPPSEHLPSFRNSPFKKESHSQTGSPCCLLL